MLVQSEIGMSWNKQGCYLECFYQGRSSSQRSGSSCSQLGLGGDYLGTSSLMGQSSQGRGVIADR
jgi:hypothetical protein